MVRSRPRRRRLLAGCLLVSWPSAVAVVVVWGLGWLAPAAHADVVPPTPASFDCARPTLVDEQIICSDAALRNADIALDRLYHEVLDATPDTVRGDAIKADQRAWLARRNRECGVYKGTKITESNRRLYVDCFLDAYAERDTDLREIDRRKSEPPSEISVPIRKSLYGVASGSADRFQTALTTSEIHIAPAATGMVVGWLDAERVAVLGTRAPKHEAARAEEALLIWRPTDGTVQPLSEAVVPAEWNGEVCISAAGAALFDPPGKQDAPLAGRQYGLDGKVTSLGGERRAPRIDCRPANDAAADHHVIAAAPGAATSLDLGPAGEDNWAAGSTIVLRHGRGAFQPVDPPIRLDTEMSFSASYAAFADSFVVAGVSRTPAIRAVARRRWAKTGCLPFWTVAAATGKSERQCLPYGGYNAVEPIPLLSRAGAIFAAAPDGDSGSWAGLYAIRDNAPVLLAEGRAWLPAVSPDGCRIAFALAKSDGSKAQALLRVFDACRAFP